jgi:competence protein ComFC
MGNYIADALNLPIIDCIQKVVHTQTQSNLKGLDRINNVKNSFKITQPLTDKKIIVFDDIFTTGSTINEVAREIKNAGAKTVCAITAGYVYHEIKPQLY